MEEFIAKLLARLTEMGTFTEEQLGLVKELKIGGIGLGIQRLVRALTDAQWEQVVLEIGRRGRAGLLAMDANAVMVFDQIFLARAQPTYPPSTLDAVDRMPLSTEPSATIIEFLRGLNEVRRDAIIAKMTRQQADLYRVFEEQQSPASLKAFVDSLDSFEDLMRLAMMLEETEQTLLLTAIHEVVQSESPTEMAPAGGPTVVVPSGGA